MTSVWWLDGRPTVDICQRSFSEVPPSLKFNDLFIQYISCCVLQNDSITTRRVCSLKALALYLNEDPEMLVKEYGVSVISCFEMDIFILDRVLNVLSSVCWILLLICQDSMPFVKENGCVLPSHSFSLFLQMLQNTWFFTLWWTYPIPVVWWIFHLDSLYFLPKGFYFYNLYWSQLSKLVLKWCKFHVKYVLSMGEFYEIILSLICVSRVRTLMKSRQIWFRQSLASMWLNK